MMMRLLHLIVIGALVASAAYVYKIKFDSTLRAERVARLRSEIKRERDMTAALRAQWESLDNPARIQALAERHLALKPLDASQVDNLDRLPEHPQPPASLETPDPIGAIIEGDNAFPTADSRPAAAQ
jgi:cell division protein FtsL